jgi:predicted phosphoribosyltransferase
MLPRRPFRDRADAGRRLATRLEHYTNRPDAIVLALPRGGVPVGFEVASALHLPLDAVLVRKLGVPGHEELAMGAVTTGGIAFVDRGIVERLEITDEQVEKVIALESAELLRRELAYRDELPPADLEGKIVICVDDGLATGASMRTAVAALRRSHPARVVVAVPVASADIAEEMRTVADEVVVDELPENFRAVSVWYEDFSQTGDQEVRDLLKRSRSGLL